MRSTSPERLRDEFFKLLALEDSARALRVLKHLDLLNTVVPGLGSISRAPVSQESSRSASDSGMQAVERMSTLLTAISGKRSDNTAAAFDFGTLIMQLDRFRPQLQQHITRIYGNGRRRGELMILGALLHQFGHGNASHDRREGSESIVVVVARQLRLSHEEEKLLFAMVDNAHRVDDRVEWSALERHRFWFQLGESGIDTALLSAAVYLSEHGIELNQRRWLRFVENTTILLDAWFSFRNSLVYPELLLNGDDIMAQLNINRGPIIGQLLTALREEQATDTVTTEAEARAFVAQVYDTMT